jgi:uncharacterized protein
LNNPIDLSELSSEDQAAWQSLRSYLASKSPALVAFSGGVDSGLLAAILYQVVGNKMLAVMVDSVVHTDTDRLAAQSVADQIGFPFKVVSFNDLENEAFSSNPVDRCYICKLERFKVLTAYARKQDYPYVMEGSNADDANDYRPGLRAVAELGILSPLADCGLTKKQIRTLAKAIQLPVWDRPSTPCLATRIPYGTPITLERLQMIHQAEAYLSELGFEAVRVRFDGRTARIEVHPDQLVPLISNRSAILRFMKESGFIHITLDLEGYRQGSNNEGIV